MAPRTVVILGSTGSVGVQALDVDRQATRAVPGVALAAGGSDPALLATQAIEFGVSVVGVAKGTTAQDVQLALYAEAQRRGYHHGDFSLPRIVVGPDAAEQVAALDCDIVLNAITGAVGLRPTLAALADGRDPGTGQQGVADHRRAAGAGGGQARADRARRLRALGAGPVPARRSRRRGPQARADCERGTVPGTHARRAGRRDRRAMRWRTRPGTWARSSRATPRPWSTRVSR